MKKIKKYIEVVRIVKAVIIEKRILLRIFCI